MKKPLLALMAAGSIWLVILFSVHEEWIMKEWQNVTILYAGYVVGLFSVTIINFILSD